MPIQRKGGRKKVGSMLTLFSFCLVAIGNVVLGCYTHGPLKKWTEHFNPSHFLKLQLQRHIQPEPEHPQNLKVCNILTSRHQDGRISEVASRTGTLFPKSSAWRSFLEYLRHYSSLWRRRLIKTRASGWAGAQLLSPRILTDLKYSNLSLFDTAARIYLSRFLPEL